MVRFENRHGIAVYVTPGEVRTISPHKDDGITVIHTGDSFFNVRGTPDEVHAKLFPERFGFTSTERNEAMLRVLTWASSDNLSVPAYVRDDARKALGREAP